MSTTTSLKKDTDRLQFLTGGGEMGRLIRDFQWKNTPLGEIDGWPQSLRTALSMVLNSRFPMFFFWGPELTSFYNDAFRPSLGNSGKHPSALGQPGSVVWSEIWDIIKPLLDQVLSGGEAIWAEDNYIPFFRNGDIEEIYWTFSYSAVYDERGHAAGVFVACAETTKKVLNERQMLTLQHLSNLDTIHKTVDGLLMSVAKGLETNNKDFPFSAIYKLERNGAIAYPLAFTGIEGGRQIFPEEIQVSSPTETTADFISVVRSRKIVVSERFFTEAALPKGPWDKVPREFIYIPIINSGYDYPIAVWVAGLNPYRKFDFLYSQFTRLISDQISLEISHALAYEQERKRVEALEALDRSKTVFFSNISHEFRTPLTLILGFIEDLRRSHHGGLATENEQSLLSAHRNTLRLLRLVNTLLDFSQIEAGRMTAQYQKVNLGALTRDVASSFRSLIESAGLGYEISCEDFSEPVFVDRQMWEKIVFNLLSNAFKYTRSGTISLQVKKEEDVAVLTVSDTGVGIASDELEKIFERFYRSRNGGARTIEGTGIGLSLVRELVTLLDGKIAVNSTVGKGSTFSVSIPLGSKHLQGAELIDPAVAPDGSASADVYSGKAEEVRQAEDGFLGSREISHPEEMTRKNVLVVDDNADMRKYMERLLNKAYAVTTAENGKVAMDMIARSEPDLIISDIMMPVMDGIELLHELKQNQHTSRIPVILLSARAGEDSKIEGYETGADDYLIKPFSARELLARVRSQIRLSNLRKSVEVHLKSLFNQAPVAICILKGPDNIVELANPSILEIWRKPLSQVINKPIADALPEIREQGIVELLNEVRQTGRRFNATERLVYLEKNGKKEETYINFTYVPLVDMDGDVSGVMAIAHEVTDLVLARQAAQRSADEFEDVVTQRTRELVRKNAELEQFAYVSSHDLQEPLRKIQTFTDLISQNLDNRRETERYLHKIDASASRMSSLIKSMLLYSKTTNSVADQQEVDLNAVLADVMDDFEIMIQEKSAIITSTPLPMLKANKVQMHQLFANLISNALKFCVRIPEVSIWAAAVDNEEKETQMLLPEKTYIKLVFKDNGIGFDQQYATRVFNMFHRLNNREIYDGTGIGLALCKRIAENHHGCIRVFSETGAGSTFEVHLPV